MGATGDDIYITLDLDWTDYPVLSVQVTTPADTIEAMADLDPTTTSRHIMLYNVHVHAVSGGRNTLGWATLRSLARAIMEMLDVDSIGISGAVRTTGAKPGRRPRPLRFKRMAGP